MKYIPLFLIAILMSCSQQEVVTEMNPPEPTPEKPVVIQPIEPGPVIQPVPAPTPVQSAFPAFNTAWGLKKALYDKMVNYHKSYNKPMRYVAIADMSQHSSKKRFYLFDLQLKTVEQHNVSHGAGSDKNNDGMLDVWSNVAGSNASSQGMYKTAETYTGKHGLSLKLDGLESTNSNARARAIVMHSASYVKDGGRTGRSWGCPALDIAVYTSVMTKLKGGSLLLLGN